LMNTAFMFSLKSGLTMGIAVLISILLMLNGPFEERRELIPLFGEQYIKYKNQVKTLYFDRSMWLILISIYLISITGLIWS